MLKQRIITAIIMAIAVIGALFATNPIFWNILIALAVIQGLKEWLSFCSIACPLHQVAALVVMVAIFCAFYFVYIPLSALIIVSLCLWSVLLLYTFTEQPSVISKPYVKLAIGCWVLASSAYFLMTLKGLHNGHQWVLLFLISIWSADIGAYFTGRKFGKHKLAPTVSPGKTIEGLLGGLVLVGIVSLIAINQFFATINTMTLFIVLLCTALVSVGGDLFESRLKRQANMKDSSQILPGHGGVLDRIDSILAGLPVFVAGLSYLGQF